MLGTQNPNALPLPEIRWQRFLSMSLRISWEGSPLGQVALEVDVIAMGQSSESEKALGVLLARVPILTTHGLLSFRAVASIVGGKCPRRVTPRAVCYTSYRVC